MKKEDVMVMYDSPEAASIQTVTGWVSRNGHFWKDDEHMARYDGCTHRLCTGGCGDVVEKHGYCRKCWDQRKQEKFEAMEFEPWDGESPIYSEWLDKYFFHGEVFDYLEEDDDEGNPYTEENLMLVHCEPVYLHLLDTDIWEDELHTEDDSAEVPVAVQDALDRLNEEIRKAGPVAWEASNKKVLLPLRPAVTP